jgi:hypothetical protein
MAPMKQAEYPAANNCSGLVAPPGPPNSLGGASFTSSKPSLETERPSRPPVEVATAV